jgi:phage-related protein
VATSNLPKTGVQAVVENIDSFVKDITTVNKAIDNSGKTASNAAKKIDPANKALDGLNDKLKNLTKQSGPAGNALSGVLDKLGGIPPAALAAVAGIALIIGAVVGLGAAFLNLGERGAPLQEIGVAFDHITANIGINSQKLLKDLQAASEGTIANFELIKIASNALIGVSGDLGKSLGEKLPELLKIAKVQADATGKSVGDLYDNLVEGIKKGTPKLIESTGLIIDQKKAYQDYAQSLGETVAQLSDADKSQALLNATLEAGQASINALGNAQESNADKIDRINASITNIFDGLAVSVQPVFGLILDGVQRIINVFAGFAPYLAIIFNFVGKVISGIVNKLADIIPPDLPKRLFEGAAAAFGSFANGIIKVANTLIFPAVIAIAKFIADFLIGFSPPKEGPLSVIDKGGENLMKAWLEGISGVSLDPVKQVAQQVSDALGKIGKQSLVQVNARLAQLDKSLLPFQNRLDIIKANFDALNEPAKAALDAIQRETDKLQDQVAQGNPQAVERLKILDAQRQAIQDQVDAQQGLVDRAQIQLALAQAQQAPERALLTIRQKALQALIQAQPKEAGGGAAKEKQPKAGAAGVISPEAGAGTVKPTGGGPLPSVLDLVGGQDQIDQAAQGLQTAFMGAIDESNITELAKNSLDLGTQIDRIKSVDLGSKITDKFKGLTDAFDPSVAGSVANIIYQFFNGDASNPNSIAGIINQLGNSLNIDDTVAKINAEFAWVTDPKSEGSPANIFATLTGDATVPGSIASFFANLPQNVSDAASGLAAKIKTDVLDPVAVFLTGTAPGSLGDILNQAVGFFTGLPTRIVDALRTLGATAYSAIAVPIIQAINGLIGGIESGLQTLVDQIAGFVDGINTTLGDAAPQFLKNAAAGLHGTKVKFGRISEEIPAFLQSTAPAGAKGGLFGEGLFKVGERGPEYLFSGQKFGVLPNELTRVLSSLESIMAQPQPMPIYSGGNSTVNNSSSNFTFNGVQSDNDARRRYNYLRAGMR